MSAQANVFAIHALDELRGALGRFAGEAQQVLGASAQEIRRVQDWLAERQAHWQREVRRRQEILHQAQAALRHCQSQVYYDPQTGRSYQPDCSAFEAQVVRARVYLAEAEAELQNVMRWARLVQQAVVDYERQAQRLGGMLTVDLPKATALLGRSATILQSYTSMSSAASSAGMVTTPAAPFTGQATTAGDWVEHGIQDVPLDQIDLSDSHVKGPEDYRKVSHDEMRAGVQRLEEVVRPAVRDGADGGTFSQMDAQQGLDYAHGYRKVYDAFYGTIDPIRLERVGDVYQVIGGYHRLLVAREMRLTSIPASVIVLTVKE